MLQLQVTVTRNLLITYQIIRIITSQLLILAYKHSEPLKEQFYYCALLQTQRTFKGTILLLRSTVIKFPF